jgi:hypothetical protein
LNVSATSRPGIKTVRGCTCGQETSIPRVVTNIRWCITHS